MVFLEFGYAIYSFGLLFVACEIAQRACDAFNSFDLDIGQIDWYLYPIVMKKMLPVILNMAQKPVEFKWFGSLAADRDTFKKVNILLCYTNQRYKILQDDPTKTFHFSDLQ